MKSLSNALNSVIVVEKPAIKTTRDQRMKAFFKVILKLGDQNEIIEETKHHHIAFCYG